MQAGQVQTKQYGQLSSLVDDQATAHSDRAGQRKLDAIAALLFFAVCLAVPFALKAAEEFARPLVFGMVLALLLGPLVQLLERFLPATLAAFFAILAFIFAVNAALILVVAPLFSWLHNLPESIHKLQSKAKPLVELLNTISAQVGTVSQRTESLQIAEGRGVIGISVSAIQNILGMAPAFLFQTFFALLLCYYMLVSRSALKRKLIVNRTSFSASLKIARIIRDVGPQVSKYIITVSAINFGMGSAVAAIMALYHMPTPVMWGGLAMLLNFIPYIGPLILVAATGISGLLVFPNFGLVFFVMLSVLAVHLVEANIITPMLLSKRFAMNPASILVSLSLFSWIWGIAGALLSVPLLIIWQQVAERLEMPDFLGLVFNSKETV